MRSFGTGANVKLPGASPDRPNVYDFDTTYEEMAADLLSKDRQLYLLIINAITVLYEDFCRLSSLKGLGPA